MSAIARYFLHTGIAVGGYDRTSCALTEKLREEGAWVHYTDDPSSIPSAFTNPQRCLVVYTPAIPAEHQELQYFRNHGFEVQKRAQVLGTLTHALKGLCVAGTHGKTTTSSMAAHILHQSHVDCNAFLGGITKNYGTNYILSKKSEYVVIEADEFDRSFHHLTPYIAVVTATDPDHLDIYGNYENYLESFAHFTELIRPDGTLLIHTGLKLKPRVAEGVKTFTYSRNDGDYHAQNIRKGDGEIEFDFVTPDGIVPDIKLGVPVDINIENAVAAMAVCHMIGVDADAMRTAIGTFMGAKRRFEFWLKQPLPGGHVVIDDYAHHPNEIKASIKSVKDLYAGRKLSVIFQPHLYTRTRDFANEFAEALSLADEVYLLPIYPAREAPIPGVTTQIIYDKVTSKVKKNFASKEDLLKSLQSLKFEVLLTVGAGDIVNLLPQICEEVQKQK